MSNISLKLSKESIEKLKNTFKDYIKPSNNEFIDTFISKDNVTISIYKTQKVLFQGSDAHFYAEGFIENNFTRQAGSDEVGTGDFFGPVVVASTIVEKEDEEFLNNLGVKDSKEISDQKILEVGKVIKDKIKNSILILDNPTYNKIHETNNLNQIKAKLHNKAFLNLIAKGYDVPSAAYIDDFCGKDKYFEYLKNEKEVYHDVILEEKAESKYIAVAAASCLARYVFLIKLKEMEDKYKMKFHKGASSEVDTTANEFVKKYSKNELFEVSKIHFKNYSNVK